MENTTIVDLSNALPPVEESNIVSVWYDELTGEVVTYSLVRPDGNYVDLSSQGLANVRLVRNNDTLRYANPVYAKNYYDTQKQMVINKPKVVLTPDKLTAVGNGEDLITITVTCKDYLNNDAKWDKLKLKSITGKDDKGNDIPGIAQVSAEVLVWDDKATSQTFKVRSFSRGKTIIKGKYYWDEATGPKLKNGSPSFPVSYGEVELTFSNPGF